MTRARRSTSDESRQDVDIGQAIVVIRRRTPPSTGIQVGASLADRPRNRTRPAKSRTTTASSPYLPDSFKFCEGQRTRAKACETLGFAGRLFARFSCLFDGFGDRRGGRNPLRASAGRKAGDRRGPRTKHRHPQDMAARCAACGAGTRIAIRQPMTTAATTPYLFFGVSPPSHSALQAPRSQCAYPRKRSGPSGWRSAARDLSRARRASSFRGPTKSEAVSAGAQSII
jgi:hypothetical protein